MYHLICRNHATDIRKLKNILGRDETCRADVYFIHNYLIENQIGPCFWLDITLKISREVRAALPTAYKTLADYTVPNLRVLALCYTRIPNEGYIDL